MLCLERKSIGWPLRWKSDHNKDYVSKAKAYPELRQEQTVVGLESSVDLLSKNIRTFRRLPHESREIAAEGR